MGKTIIAIVILLAAGCAKKVPLRTNHSGPGWAAQCDKTSCFVIARDQDALEAARKAVCGICAIDTLGEAYMLERIAK